MRSQPVLMIEDDHRLAALVVAYLAQNEFNVQHVETATAGLALLTGATTDPFALVLLDLMLPDADGLEVCRRIRELGTAMATVPVLMLTAKGDPMDRVVGLELGADDYLAKPFEPRELLARMRALLRRRNYAGAPGDAPLRFGRLEIDPAARAVRVDGALRVLTSYQYDLLLALAERAGRVLSREQLMDLVKGEPLAAFDRSIDVHIARLRQVLEDDARQPRRILTIRGAGYVFARSQDS